MRASLIEACRQLGGLNVLVNNASELGTIGPLAAFDVPRFGRLFPVNVGAPMVLVQLALPLLTESRGLIVNITSDAAKAAYPGWGPYGATKAALELLTRTLASELREQGVSAVLVDPGDMRTRMQQEAFPGKTFPIDRSPRSPCRSGAGCSIRIRRSFAASGSPRSTRTRGGCNRRD